MATDENASGKRNGRDRQDFFNAVVSEVNLFGMERRFYDLSALPGPDPPNWLDGQTLYEIYVRCFSPQGTFAGVTGRLPELQELGVNLLWLMPIFPIGEKKRKGRLGSPYAVRDYFAVNPELGEERDFRGLVRAAHDRGMKIILDLVANHVAPDYAGFRSGEAQAVTNAQGRPTRQIKDWSDVVDLDYNQAATGAHMLRVMRYWVEHFDVDGFRCDVAGLVPLDFWERAADRLRAIKPDFFLLAEWESPLLHRRAFHASYDWSLYELMLRVARGQWSPEQLPEWVNLKSRTYPARAQFLRFLENHDKPRAVKVFGKNRLNVFLDFLFSLPGLPLIYNGQEIGCARDCSLFDKDTIDWEQGDEHLRRKIQTLIRLRKERPALRAKNLRPMLVKAERTVAYFKQSGKDRLLVVLNFSDRAARVRRAEIPEAGELMPLLSDSKEHSDGEIILPPWSGEYFALGG